MSELMPEMFSTKRLDRSIIDMMGSLYGLRDKAQEIIERPSEENLQLLIAEIQRYGTRHEALLENLHVLLKQTNGPETDELEITASGNEETGVEL